MDPVLEQLTLEQQERVTHAPSARERAVETGAGVLLVVASIGLWFLSPGGVTVEPGVLVALIAGYALLWQVTFQLGSGVTTSVQLAFVPMWFAVDPALLPLVVAAGAIVGNIGSSLRAHDGMPWQRVFIAVPDALYAFGPAIVLAAFGPSEPSFADWSIYVLALAAQFAADGISATARVWAATGVRPRDYVNGIWWMWWVDAALAPVGLLLAVCMGETGWALLAGAPLAILLGQFARERDARILKALELSSAYRGTAQLMGDVLEADDAYTGGEHTQGVVEMAAAVGRELALPPARLRDLEFGALLHDIGKLRVPNEIINKPGKLDEAEWAIIKQHPAWGQEMLDRVGGALGAAGLIVRAHHERFDGHGYPDGLVGEEIPLEARIITACDSYSAMTTDRAYRKAMSRADALEELTRCTGSQFDPQVVEALGRVIDRQPIAVPAQRPAEIDLSSTPVGRSAQAA